MSNEISDDVVEKILEAAGAGPDDTIQIITPQFQRTDGKVVPAYPGDTALVALALGTDQERFTMGLGRWNTPGEAEDGDTFGGGVLWLLPGEWYDYLPPGFPFVTISGYAEPFERGLSDNDIRFGRLPYGIVVGARKGWIPKVGA